MSARILEWARTELTRRPDPGRYYDLMGTGGLVKNELPVINMGFWRDVDPAREDAGEDASEALAALVRESAEIGPRDEVVDVGCGFGANAIRCVVQHSARRAIGINVSAVQLAYARRLAARAGCRDVVWFVQRDATELPFADASVDKILCIEAAFHFSSRCRFFAECRRILRPGGLLVGADLVVTPPRDLKQRIALNMLQRGLQIPPENTYGAGEYRARLARAELEVLDFRSIRRHVVPGCRSWNMGHWRRLARNNNVVMQAMIFPFWSYPWDYVVFKARKAPLATPVRVGAVG